ncbi:methylenetetrahydrofolate reductase [Streptomyces sp. NPDC057137]|uniref:methylenetetrahydrofolate reductase n=1 Tax=Streptomyces sp. NPDC057137 TaxID=3346030 RepID=UPI003640E132
MPDADHPGDRANHHDPLAAPRRFAGLSTVVVPPGLAERMLGDEDNPKAVKALGIDHATEMCRRLIREEAPGLHFMTMNFSEVTREINQNLGLRS